jgi:hypothetical protein
MQELQNVWPHAMSFGTRKECGSLEKGSIHTQQSNRGGVAIVACAKWDTTGEQNIGAIHSVYFKSYITPR